MSDFTFRNALPSDRDEVLALAANTWEDGDYIHWVFDDWVADMAGRFLVALDASTGRIAGINKLSFLSPTEAWFEGLRVHPDYRRRGLAASFQTFMIGEARRLGAKTVRLLTVVDNLPVYRKAYRDGFSARFVVRHYKWLPQEDELPQSASPTNGTALRPAGPDEASALYDWWTRSSSWHATCGLLNRTWSFSATSADEWVQFARDGVLLVQEETNMAELAVPPPIALISEDVGGESGKEWTVSMLSASGSEWPVLAAALTRYAAAQGVARVEGLLPDSASLLSALTAAGFTTEPDHECLCLFELSLPGMQGRSH